MKVNINNLIPYVVMCVLLTAMAIWAKKNEQDASVLMMSEMQKDLPELVPDYRNAVMIDVRTPTEYKNGHIKGAYNIPRDRINHEIPFLSIPQDKQIVLYCRSGRRAQLALEALREIGYKNVINLNVLYDKKQEAEKTSDS